jgi:predicted Zn-dependent peptidase
MRKLFYEAFGETVYIIDLKNGMKVHVLPKEEPYYSTYVELSVPFGGQNLIYRYNQQLHVLPPGVAHFFEHKIFAMPDGDAFTKFSKYGADANAMTSYDQTSYMFQTTEHLIECLTHLLEMIDVPYFTLENIEQEKNIIAEELKMYLDDPNTEMHNHLMENMYHKHPLKYDIGGTLDSIKTIDKEMLENVHQHFYQPKNRLLVIAGKIDIQLIQDFFKQYDSKTVHKHRRIPSQLIEKEPRNVVKKYEVKPSSYGINRIMLGVKFAYKKREPVQQVRRELAISMLLNMLLGASSDHYQALLKEGLINQSFYVSAQFEKQAESFFLYAETKYVRKLKTILNHILFETLSEYVLEDDFLRYKKVYLGQFIIALNSLETKAYLYGKYYHAGLSLFNVVDLLSSITYQEVLDIIFEIKKKYSSILIYKKA